jgi:hypothetical protein
MQNYCRLHVKLLHICVDVYLSCFIFIFVVSCLRAEIGWQTTYSRNRGSQNSIFWNLLFCGPQLREYVVLRAAVAGSVPRRTVSTHKQWMQTRLNFFF